MQLKLAPGFKNRVRGKFGKYSFEVGILKDGPHYQAKRGARGQGGKDVLKTYAGGDARQQTKIPNGTLSQVSKEFREHLGVNYLTAPFKKRSSDIIKFSNEFFKLVFGRSQKKRAENLLQAVVRNPILRGDYGHNSELTKKIKGFNRLGIDTAQLFKNIKAQCKVKGA